MISFIIPTFNEEKDIEKTLRSIWEYPGEKEIIVADGGSTDHTVILAKTLADQVIEHAGLINENAASGRNAGAVASMGELLIFIDADVCIPQVDVFCAQVLSRFRENPKLVGLTTSIRVFPESETWMDKTVFCSLNFFHFLMNNVFCRSAAAGEIQVIRADVFKRIGGYNELMAMNEDYDMFRRLRKQGRTRMELGLVVYHTGRRAHIIGWPRLLWEWWLNSISGYFFKKWSMTRRWEKIR